MMSKMNNIDNINEAEAEDMLKNMLEQSGKLGEQGPKGGYRDVIRRMDKRSKIHESPELCHCSLAYYPLKR